MTPDFPAALAAARATYERLLREPRTAEACWMAEDALRDLLAAIDAAPPAAEGSLTNAVCFTGDQEAACVVSLAKIKLPPLRYVAYAKGPDGRYFSLACRESIEARENILLARIVELEAMLTAAMSATRDESSRVAVTVPVRRADLAALAAADFGRSGWSAELEQVAVRMRAALAECAQEARHAPE